MAEFGEQLRLQRESRGVALSALCAETKVNPRHFEALERGDLHQLPGGVFRRGILRSYLKALDLDEQEWMPRFEELYAANARKHGLRTDPGEEAWVAFAMNVRKNRKRKRSPTGPRWIAIGLLALALLAAAWTVWRLQSTGAW